MIEPAPKGKVIRIPYLCPAQCCVIGERCVCLFLLDSASFLHHLTSQRSRERIMISMCGCYIISSYLWISTPPSPTPPPPCISARRTESLPWYYRRSTLVSCWNIRFAFIESQTCPCTQCGLVRTPQSWMTSLCYFYTWRVDGFIDCRTIRQFPVIYDYDLTVNS